MNLNSTFTMQKCTRLEIEQLLLFCSTVNNTYIEFQLQKNE